MARQSAVVDGVVVQQGGTDRDETVEPHDVREEAFRTGEAMEKEGGDPVRVG